MALLFVYGTLQHPPLLARLLGRVPASTPATVEGFRVAPLAGRVYPGLVTDDVARATGRLIEVTDHEVALLDAFEGGEYERRDVVATPLDGPDAIPAPVPAQAWVLTGPSSKLAVDGSWSFERFLATDVDAFLERSVQGEPHPGAGS